MRDRLPPYRTALPYRGVFGAARPPALGGLPLPPGPMPARDGRRPLKAWRYVGVFGPQLMLCVASVRIGPARQSFWAVWDREAQRLHEHTALGRGGVRLGRGTARVLARGARIELELSEEPGIETISPAGCSYAWTRKQGGVPARGAVELDGVRREIDSLAVIDDTAAYYERHTSWRWSAGIGRAATGSAVAWNLVEGVNDAASSSERTVWIDGCAEEVGPCAFAADLSAVGGLRFTAEAVRERRDNLLLVRSHYRQPFGTFRGELPGGVALAEGYGVMEAHDAWW